MGEAQGPKGGDEADDGAVCRSERRAALIEQLFRQHNQSLVRFLAAKLHSEQEARDVAQEAYVRVLRLDAPEAVSYLRAFLFRTAANIAIDRLRSRNVETRAFDLFESLNDEPSVERGAVASEELGLLARFIDELPPKCRQAFLLRRLHGLSAEEVARSMGIPARTVRHYVVEAMVYCQGRLRGDRAKLRRREG